MYIQILLTSSLRLVKLGYEPDQNYLYHELYNRIVQCNPSYKFMMIKNMHCKWEKDLKKGSTNYSLLMIQYTIIKLWKSTWKMDRM